MNDDYRLQPLVLTPDGRLPNIGDPEWAAFCPHLTAPIIVAADTANGSADVQRADASDKNLPKPVRILAGNTGNSPLGAVTKRAGGCVAFDQSNIRRSVAKCLHRCNIQDAPIVAKTVADKVAQILMNSPDEPLLTSRIRATIEIVLRAMNMGEVAALYASYLKEAAARRTGTQLDADRIHEDDVYFRAPHQRYQLNSKYARWNDVKRRRETWSECVERSMTFFTRKIEEDHPQASTVFRSILPHLQDSILNMRAMPSMRLLQMAGEPAQRCNVCLYNCAYLTLNSSCAFAEMLYILMQGTGVGFSVEEEYVCQLPGIRKQRVSVPVETFVVPDSSAGWCDALQQGLEHWMRGEDLVFDYSEVRPQGTRLAVLGGQAGGPEILQDLLTSARTLILARQGARLTPQDCFDLACKIADTALRGAIRRSSLICLCDLEDEEMRHAKSGNWLETAPHRAMANISAVYTKRPEDVVFMDEMRALALSQSGERGIFNRGGVLSQLSARREKATFGTNPCGEILLLPQEFCNLSIVVAREDDTPASLIEKVKIAAILGTIQSTFTSFNYLRREWATNCQRERLLGVDITGQMDCPLLRPGAKGREELLTRLQQVAIETNREWAQILGIAPSAGVTCVKPSGNSGQLLDCSSGLHPRYAPYYIRRFQAKRDDPVTEFLIEAGVPWRWVNDEITGLAAMIAFEFPVKSPPGAITRNDMTTCEQLDNWLTLKQSWTEHNPSCTIYVDAGDWIVTTAWVWEHWDLVGGLSFLQKDGGNYPRHGAPYEEISQEEYEELMAVFPVINWADLMYYESVDTTVVSQELACTANACELP